eukprot:6110257-Prymnesium_polylepis.1
MVYCCIASPHEDGSGAEAASRSSPPPIVGALTRRLEDHEGRGVAGGVPRLSLHNRWRLRDVGVRCRLHE